VKTLENIDSDTIELNYITCSKSELRRLEHMKYDNSDIIFELENMLKTLKIMPKTLCIIIKTYKRNFTKSLDLNNISIYLDRIISLIINYKFIKNKILNLKIEFDNSYINLDLENKTYESFVGSENGILYVQEYDKVINKLIKKRYNGIWSSADYQDYGDHEKMMICESEFEISDSEYLHGNASDSYCLYISDDDKKYDQEFDYIDNMIDINKIDKYKNMNISENVTRIPIDKFTTKGKTCRDMIKRKKELDIQEQLKFDKKVYVITQRERRMKRYLENIQYKTTQFIKSFKQNSHDEGYEGDDDE